MTKLLLLLLLIVPTSLYDLSIQTVGGESVSLKSYQGKKILVVNIATASPFAATQLPQLEQLQQQFKDSLIILAVPSHSFNGEPKSNSELKAFFRQTFKVSYLITAKGSVKGDDKHALYQWLTKKEKNGRMDTGVRGDFQKFLIGEDGNLVGVFAPAVAPLSEELMSAVRSNYSN